MTSLSADGWIHMLVRFSFQETGGRQFDSQGCGWLNPIPTSVRTLVRGVLASCPEVKAWA